MISSDTYSITNPALGSFVLWSFLQGYESNNKQGCPYLLLFLPLPLMLSESIRKDFRGTNSATGLHTWVSRNQKHYCVSAREWKRQVRSQKKLLFLE